MTSEITSRGTRDTTSAMTGASSSAGTMRVARTFGARRSERGEHGRAGAAGLEEIRPGGWGPPEVDGLASHERAVRVGLVDASRKLTAPGAPTLAALHERAALAHV